jgi:hypothetical protein
VLCGYVETGPKTVEVEFFRAYDASVYPLPGSCLRDPRITISIPNQCAQIFVNGTAQGTSYEFYVSGTFEVRPNTNVGLLHGEWVIFGV